MPNSRFPKVVDIKALEGNLGGFPNGNAVYTTSVESLRQLDLDLLSGAEFGGTCNAKHDGQIVFGLGRAGLTVVVHQLDNSQDARQSMLDSFGAIKLEFAILRAGQVAAQLKSIQATVFSRLCSHAHLKPRTASTALSRD